MLDAWLDPCSRQHFCLTEDPTVGGTSTIVGGISFFYLSRPSFSLITYGTVRAISIQFNKPLKIKDREFWLIILELIKR